MSRFTEKRVVRLFGSARWWLLPLLAALPYLGSLHHPLLRDDRTLLDNRWLRDEADLPSVFRHEYWYGTRHEGARLYRPLTVLSLAWTLRGAKSSFGFRAVNVILHAAATLLVAWFLFALLSAAREPGDSGRRVSRGRAPPTGGGAAPAAWIGAALFAVHPLASEAVLFAVGRADILAAGLGLAAFTIWLGEERRTRARVPRLAASAVLFFLALLSKESAVSWLVVAVAWTLVVSPKRMLHRGWWLRGSAHLAALAVFLAVRGQVVGWTLARQPWVDNPLVRVDSVTRVANAVLILARYLGKMFFPARLSVEYGFHQVPVTPLVPWGGLLAAAVLAAWVAVLLALRRRFLPAAFLWTMIPAAFAVTGNVLLPIGTIFAERLAYLPLVGACGLAGYGAAALASRRRGAATVVLVLVLGAAGARTFVRTGDFRSLAAFNEATAKASPRAVKALFNAGRTRLRTGHPREAVEPLERAVRIWPGYTRALELLSRAYAAAGEPARAAEAARRAKEARGREAEPPPGGQSGR